MDTRQAVPRQGGQPGLRHLFCRRGRAARVQQHIAGQGDLKRPADKLGVQLPTQAKAAHIDTHMGGVLIRNAAVVVAQQGGQMLAAGLALGAVADHDQVGQRGGRGN